MLTFALLRQCPIWSPAGRPSTHGPLGKSGSISMEGTDYCVSATIQGRLITDDGLADFGRMRRVKVVMIGQDPENG